MKFLNTIDGANKLVEDADHRLVSDTEKATWNAKASTALATSLVAGLMSGPDKEKLDGVSTGANKTINHATNGSISVDGVEQVVYSHPTGAGNNHIPTGGASGQFLKWSSSGVAVWAADNNTVYTHPTTAGNKHIPSGGAANQILRYSANGTAVWSNENNTTYVDATTSVSGLMSAADKTKLNGVSTGANKTINHATNGSISVDGVEQVVYAHPTTTGNKHIPSGGAAGQFLKYSADGTAEWHTFSGTQSTAGYQTLPNGLILQYGQFAHPAGTNYSSLTFPLTFPTGCISLTGNFRVMVSGYDPSSTATWAAWCVAFHGVGTTGANVMIRAGDDNSAPSSSGWCYWLAVGY